MDYKKTNAPATTVTRDMMELCADTGNVYETVAIIGKCLVTCFFVFYNFFTFLFYLLACIHEYM